MTREAANALHQSLFANPKRQCVWDQAEKIRMPPGLTRQLNYRRKRRFLRAGEVYIHGLSALTVNTAC
jgi:hypothetical protein